MKDYSWISFQADPKSAAPQFWLLLGEAQARCAQISGAPLRPSVARALGRIRTARGILASAAIAGSTLTEDEVLRHLDGRLDLAPTRQQPTRLVGNLAAAFARAESEAAAGRSPPASPELLAQINRELLAGLTLPAGARPALLRAADEATDVPPAAGDVPPAAALPDLLARLCAWLEAPRPGPPVAVAIMRSLLAHLYVLWIRPFAAGNAGTAHLLAHRLLLRAGVAAPAAHLPVAHCARVGEDYERQVERAKRSAAGPVNFMTWALQGFVADLRAMAAEVGGAQLSDAWEAHLEERLGTRPGKTARRQRQLAAELARAGAPVPRARLRALSAATALAYAGLGDKTLLRDLADLAAEGLAERTPDGWLARTRTAVPWAPQGGARPSDPDDAG